MANYAIITDLNRCTGCLACTVACKAINGVDVGNFWIKTLRVGPHPIEGGSGTFPDVEMYFLPVQCQHCENPECVKVCPTGAIRLTDLAGKSSIQIGHAVWIAENCEVNTDGVSCNNCARHCPAGAIKMVRRDPDDPKSPRIPAVNEERCIGCGACENLCPARPFSAIYVEGHSRHRIV